MAVIGICGFEAGAEKVDDIVLSTYGGVYSTAQARTGTRSIRCNVASGSQSYFVSGSYGGWMNIGVRFATIPSSTRVFAGVEQIGGCNLRITSTGYVEVYNYTTLVGTSSVQLAVDTWYWIGYRLTVGTSVVLLQIDGVDQVTGTITSATNGQLGFNKSETGAADVYFDDLVVSNSDFVAPSKVALLLPISDYSRAALWTNGGGGTTNLYDAVNNVPPAGLATETATSQIEHAGGAPDTSEYYEANMTTYTTAGVGASDTVIALQGLVVWGEDSGTGTKLLDYGGTYNPGFIGESGVDVSAGDGSGATLNYGAGPPDYWNERRSAITTTGLEIGSYISLSESPTMWVNRPETASRVASVCFMGMYVAWTPAAAANPLPLRVYPQLLAH